MVGRRVALGGLAVAGMAAAMPSVMPMALAQPAPRTPRVVFINPGRAGEGFWDDVSTAMRAAADQLGFLLEIRMAERDRSRLRAMAIAAAQEQPAPDALLLVNEEQTAVPALEAAVQRGLPTMLLINELSGDDLARVGPPRRAGDSFIGSLSPANRTAGRRMTEALLDAARKNNLRAADGRIHLLALGGELGTIAGMERSRGMYDAVAAANDVILDRHLLAGWQQGEARLLTRRYLDWAIRAAIRPTAVWAANDPMALGAMEAFEEAGRRPGKEAVFAGLNWSAEALRAVGEGRLLLSEGGHLLGGAWALVMLRDWFDGFDFTLDGDASLQFDLSPIDAASLSYCWSVIGERRWQGLDFRRFTRGERRRGGDMRQAYDFSLPAILASAKGAG
ncbi:ABC transporter substrate-binding protein [Acetobacteraceae bacterium H6797]|nr:ABC transporter substrate-binding protein [Acetobacteraceae bacterium H6797]